MVRRLIPILGFVIVSGQAAAQQPAPPVPELVRKQLEMFAAEAQYFSALARQLNDTLTANDKYWHEWCVGEHTCETPPAGEPAGSRR